MLGRNFMKRYITIISLVTLVPFFSKAQTDSSALFEKSKNKLSHPISSFKKLVNLESVKVNFGCSPNPGNTYYTDKEDTVNAIFEGTVISIFQLENQYGLTTKFGKYYITYFGLSKPVVKRGDYIKTRQHLATLMNNLGESFQLELIISTPTRNINPSYWLK